MNQKELKAMYKHELEKVWYNSMVDYCIKELDYVVEYNGKLYGYEKPPITKEFYFGAGINGMATQEDIEFADNLVDKVLTDENYFRLENLKELNALVEELEDIANNINTYVVVDFPQYKNQPEDCKLYSYTICNSLHLDRELRFLNTKANIVESDLLEKIINGHKKVIKKYEKRLDAYLKSYGLSEVKAWSYIND